MEIFPDIHLVDGVTSNCYVVKTGDRLTLIDPGLPRNSKKIVAYLKDALDRPPSDIGTIILTHYYMDHTGSAQELKTLSGAAVGIHEADARYVMGRQLRPAPEGILVFQSTIGAFYKPRPVHPDILLHDGETVAGLTCIHTPGHTAGSICLYDLRSKVLFAGDTIRHNGHRFEGPPRPFTLDMEAARRSVAKISRLDFAALLPGHGVPLTRNAREDLLEFAQIFAVREGVNAGPVAV